MLTGSFSVVGEGASMNWSLVGGIIGGILALALVIFIILTKRRAAESG
jgi:hypothetical protein